MAAKFRSRDTRATAPRAAGRTEARAERAKAGREARTPAAPTKPTKPMRPTKPTKAMKPTKPTPDRAAGPSRSSAAIVRCEEALRERALAWPETREDHPWGECAFKVRGKVFLFLSTHDGSLHLSMKLRVSGDDVLEEPYAEPTGYGLGRSGWVTCTFARGVQPPLSRLLDLLDESFRAVAPRTLVRALPSQGTPARGGAGPTEPPRTAGSQVRRRAIGPRKDGG